MTRGKHMAKDVNFMNLQDLRKISKTFRQNSEVYTNKVMSAEEAKEMTDNDKAGHVWNVGDEYYLLRNIG